MFLLYSLGFALNFLLTITQSAGSTSYGPFYFPNSSVKTVELYYGLVNSTTLFFNWQINGSYWFGVGFADSGSRRGYMYGVDAFVYGNYGAGDYTVYEWNLGNNTIGDEDIEQQIDFTVYRTNNYHSIHLERLLNTGTRYNYVVTMSGTFCLLWAIGTDIYVTSGHGTVLKGLNCTHLGGTTKAPTPSPTWFPIAAPTTIPTSMPTLPPTVKGVTPYPTNLPTPKPTPKPTTLPPTIAPTTKAPTIPFPTPQPTVKPTLRPTLHPLAHNATIVYTAPPTDVPTVLIEVTHTAATVQQVTTNNHSISTLDIIIIIIVGLFLCFLLFLAFLLYRRSEKKRQEKKEERAKNLLEVEKYKEQYGLNINKYNNDSTPQKGTKYDNDDDDDDDDDDANDNVLKSKTEVVIVTAKKYNSDRDNDGDDEKDEKKDYETKNNDDDDDDDIVLPSIKPTPNKDEDNVKGNKNVSAVSKTNTNTNKSNKNGDNNNNNNQSRAVPTPIQTKQTNNNANAKTQTAKPTIQAANTLKAKPKTSQKASKFSKYQESTDW